MDTLSFAAGYALGRKKGGGGGGVSLFQEILKNSTQTNVIPIDDTYKFTINFWFTDRLEFPDGGFDSENYNNDLVSGQMNGDLSVCYEQIKSLMCFKIAYENDTPLFAIGTRAGLLANEVGKFLVMTDTSSGKWGYFVSKDYIYENFTPLSNIVLSVSPTDFSFTYNSGSVTLRTDSYALQQATQFDMPTVHLSGSTTATEPLGTAGTLLYPSGGTQTYSDMSRDELYSKWEDIYIAACNANGIPARKAIFVKPTA